MRKPLSDWESLLLADPLPWLLEPENPSVRYFTLAVLLDKPESSVEVRQAKQSIMTGGIVPAVLAKQSESGCWGKPEDFYMRSRYSGTVWNIITLAHLGVDAADNRIRKAGEFILRYSQDRDSGAFAVSGGERGEANRLSPASPAIWRPALSASVSWTTPVCRKQLIG